ncbi:hypothetical protein EBA05_07880 [Xanthomonas oryzae pv. oryzae]|nr:hypothetical protein C0L90_07850 [Xanthomonas oryzae pv. oryzae]QBN38877.1 hypothetical protein EBA04_07885 [Xanthomonas oryzae pv. oryzae]QBN42552.1 hypothetical protein EBA05_07880 [Xanthomonas oryzae pv. oryzae]QBN46201.1 hypothetical protein EBA06_07880 [Xanthomonas oryzae pv. oryzae]QBN53474.1 hypothetical protein EBA08_07880 [Xanthomonas oryzae pv. oryzae]
MICSSEKRFFTSNLLGLGNWTPSRCATQTWGDVGICIDWLRYRSPSYARSNLRCWRTGHCCRCSGIDIFAAKCKLPARREIYSLCKDARRHLRIRRYWSARPDEAEGRSGCTANGLSPTSASCSLRAAFSRAESFHRIHRLDSISKCNTLSAVRVCTCQKAT